MSNTAQLQEYDFVVVLDGSASMGTEDIKGGRSRWSAMREQTAAFARDLGKLDSDGIDLVLFNAGRVESWTGVDAAKVDSILAERSPRGSTPMAEALTEAFKLAGKSDKKDFVLVVTDGVPDDKNALADVIRRQAAKQNADDECTVLFVQIGYDTGAAQYLRTLDDGLNAKYDIVDAKTMEEAEQFASTAELVVAAIND